MTKSSRHLKKLNAPNNWMLPKLGGKWAAKPSPGPHKASECLPLVVLLRNRLKYALTAQEVQSIVMSKQIKIDGKVRTDSKYPAGFMDVVSIPKLKKNYRLLYDTKGRFFVHEINDQESKIKLCSVRQAQLGHNGIPYIVTHDGRTIRYPHPDIRVHDTVKLDLATGKVVDFLKFDIGNLCMLTRGKNAGRVGTIYHKESHDGANTIIHIRDSSGSEFATTIDNVFVLGKGNESWVTLPGLKGVKINNADDLKHRMASRTK